MSGQVRALRLGIDLGSVDDPSTAVELAGAAERLGYDYVVVPTPADEAAWEPWTLLSWIAGRTERIALVASSLDLSQRHPSVLARAAASLDLLAAGRVTLGLADGSADAVTILRRMWDTSADRVHHHGRYQVAGAEPGPLPAHDIAVWLGGPESSAIEVAGQVGDGWIDHLDDAGTQQLVQRLRQLERETTRAGRDPRELQRVVTLPGSADAEIEQVAALIADHRISTVVLRVDDAITIERLETFAEEVTAPLRVAAEQAVAGGTITTRPLRRADVRARRRPGIDYDALPATLAETAVEPGDVRYAAVRSTYMRGGAPGLVLRPRTTAEVADAVAYAGRHRHLPLGVRSGGHGISGRSTNDGGLVIDVGALNDIEVLDADRRLVRIGPGARWRDVATALHPHGWALTSGDYGGVGVGGLATAGGIGFLGRQQGLTIDHLQAAELVLADGSLVRASHTEEPDLFWAVRGAGANFGIATAFEFVVDEVPDVGWAQLAFRVTDPAAFLVQFGRAAAEAPRDTTAFLVMGGPDSAHVMAMVASDDPNVVVSRLEPLAALAPLAQQHAVIAPYAAVMNMFPDTAHQGRGEPIARSGLIDALTPEVAAVSANLLTSGAAQWFQLRTMGGAIADVDATATAFSHRDAAFHITVMGRNAQRLDQRWDELRAHLTGTYLSFETDTSPDRLAEAFPPDTLVRLKALKARFDPANLFRDNFNLMAAPTPIRSTA